MKAGLHASLLGLFNAALFRAWPNAKTVGVTDSQVVKCSNYKHGDFQCNVAMPLYTALKVGLRHTKMKMRLRGGI